ncbi:hypothetical protein CAPTEDRAFT_205337 [Capitella teleta]|uniref:Uncharacterized protein n=1 Tax=Capitella teleta TaxID=283909 RepID=R7TV17_CAPTE|nr:hypothetical protein CAPTEDRAFT_205337 [Capitella teleta]|eukprot:ELT94840.1 hypothetical protein CAPTEDRAFT_205337 [Capitella teleta]
MAEGNGEITEVEVDRACKEIALGKAGDESGVFGEYIHGLGERTKRKLRDELNFIFDGVVERYREDKKICRREERYENGEVRMMVRGDSLLVRASANVAWRYDEDDRKCVCGEEETEEHVLFECSLYERQRIELSKVWRMQRGQEDPMNGVLGFGVPSEMDCLILRSVGAIWREREKHERERE